MQIRDMIPRRIDLVAPIHEPFWTEFWSAVVAICWSKIVWAMPLDLIDKPQYKILSNIMDDAHWEVVGCTLGVIQLISLILNFRVARWVLAFMMSWWWLIIGYAIFLSDPSSPGCALYGGFGFMNLTTMILLSFRRKSIPRYEDG